LQLSFLSLYDVQLFDDANLVPMGTAVNNISDSDRASEKAIYQNAEKSDNIYQIRSRIRTHTHTHTVPRVSKASFRALHYIRHDQSYDIKPNAAPRLPKPRVTFTCSPHIKLHFDDDIEMKVVEYFTVVGDHHHHDDTNEQMVEPSAPAPVTVPVQVALDDVHDSSAQRTSFLLHLRWAEKFLFRKLHWNKQ
jgi:hypothetical protein